MPALSTGLAAPVALPLPESAPLINRENRRAAQTADPAPLRCRLGLHRWLPLALGLPGSTAPRVSFCRCCPALRHG